MGTLNKILNALIKFLFIVAGLAIALLPIVYIYAHEHVSRQQWTPALQKFTGRQGQAGQARGQSLGNVYLRGEKGKLSWSDVNATIELANYLQHQLEKSDVTVVRRLLEFRKPAAAKKLKGAAQSEEADWGESNQIIEVPPLRWLRDMVEPYLAFEHETLKRKHWVIVCLGQLDARVATEIQNLLKKNAQYRVTLVSPWPISSKMVDITPIHYDGPSEVAVEAKADAPEAVEKEKGKEEKQAKEAKTKKEVKIKVKQVKQVKTAPQNANNDTQTEDL